MSHFYVTTPIYYVNDLPHIGHAYTTILADVLARYNRLKGTPTFFLTGTDEHGQKVQEAARKAGITPLEHADKTVARFQDLWRKLEITNDDFIRTTEKRHGFVVQKILQDLYDRDEIYKAEYDGWYCVTCERFFTEKDLAEGRCPDPGCGKPVERVKESNYFFRMSKYQDWLVRHINDNPEFIQPDFRRNETLGFLKKKLNDLCVSRPKSRLNWGIELPFDKEFVTYVWFDALVNYISAIGYAADDGKFEKWWPVSIHLIGKDILTTHTVYWPTMLKAMGAPMPKTIFAHGWWLSGRDKMSKSAGNVVNPISFADKYGADAFRYFLMAEMPLGQDTAFTEEAFARRYNVDLANDLGNMLSRVMKLIAGYCSGAIPPPGEPGSEEQLLRETALSAAAGMIESVDTMKLDQGLAQLAGVIREANRYLEKKQPWTLAKKGDAAGLGTVLYHAAEVLRIVSGALSPVMPNKMAELRESLGIIEEKVVLDDLKVWGKLKPGLSIGKQKSLFPRIDVETKPMAPVSSEDAKARKPESRIDYSVLEKVELRTAKIMTAEKIEGADKLLRLRIRVGDEERQIVAGIAQHYKPEELPGKTIVIVANLMPARIRGVESDGMLLAASRGTTLRLVSPDGDIESGAIVK